MLDRVSVRLLSLPLRVPYKLAFGPVTAFETLLVELTDADGREGYGEATYLRGYTEEETADGWRAARELAAALPGCDPVTAEATCAARLPTNPFTVTAFVTALEMLGSHPLLEAGELRRVPILAILNAEGDDAIAAELETLIAAGYRTIKVKVGFDPAADAARVRFIQRRLDGRAALRVDANQGFTQAQAIDFISALDPEGIELIEQTCKAGDWDAAVAVAAASPIPLMLDESIFGPDDIARAAELGAARLIKLKLMKCGGIGRLTEALARIRALGMTPVLGNGVASDLSCWMEACVAAEAIDNAGEMNGFLKPLRPLFAPPLAVRDGAIELPAALRPRLDREAVEAATVALEDTAAKR